jgi:hypothetical protein
MFLFNNLMFQLMTTVIHYPDAPERPNDDLYMIWLNFIRKNREDELNNITEIEQLISSGDPMPSFVNFSDILPELKRRAADNHAIALEIIADPENERNQEMMRRATSSHLFHRMKEKS